MNSGEDIQWLVKVLERLAKKLLLTAKVLRMRCTKFVEIALETSRLQIFMHRWKIHKKVRKHTEYTQYGKIL